MNLYKFHTDSQSLLYGNSAPDQLPQLFGLNIEITMKSLKRERVQLLNLENIR